MTPYPIAGDSKITPCSFINMSICQRLLCTKSMAIVQWGSRAPVIDELQRLHYDATTGGSVCVVIPSDEETPCG